jgi:nucleosome assembly protein 1-like 1
MSEPIRNQQINKLAEAPTPQNTPAGASSFISRAKPNIGATISEEPSSTNDKLLSLISDKLGGISLAPFERKLTKKQRNVVRALRVLQRQCDLWEMELEAGVMELEKKCHIKSGPLYERRRKIVQGIEEPTAEEIEQGLQIEKEEEEEDEDAPRLEEIPEEGDEEVKESDDEKKETDEEADVKGIPNFWATALSNVPEISPIITEDDQEALQYLIDVHLEYLEKEKGEELGFKLIFDFAENDFFSNSSLVKTYYYHGPNLGPDFAIHIKDSKGDTINWKSPQRNLTVEITSKKQRNKRTGAFRTVEKEIPKASFFNFFSPPPSDEFADMESEENDDFQVDSERGVAIKDMLPRAVDWFTGKALEYNDDFDEDDFEDEDDSDYSDDQDDDDDSDESDDDEKPKKHVAVNQDCKQQ